MREFENRTTQMQTGILAELKNTAKASGLVERETKSLSAALRMPNMRGTWGELSLARALEHLGLIERCDFACQVTVTDKDGSQHRPDVVVRMTGERGFPMDAKAPMGAFLGSVQTRVIPVARKFADDGIGDRAQLELAAVEVMPRPITSGELLAALPEPQEPASAEPE